MAETLNVLQIGSKNWATDINNLLTSNNINWIFLDVNNWKPSEIKKFKKEVRGTFEVALITEEFNKKLFEATKKYMEAYRVIVDEKLSESTQLKELIELKWPLFRDFSDKENLIKLIVTDFFGGQSGSKIKTTDMVVNPNFNGTTIMKGESFTTFNGDFSALKGENLMTWQLNMSMYDQSKKLSLEFYHDTGVEIELHIGKINKGSADISEILTFSEEEIKNGIDVEYSGSLGYLAVSISAKGVGELNLGSFHFRRNRHGLGEFLVGGNKVTDSKGQELIYYLNPGDLKPPLTVYFSGYRSAEGFEGFYMMKGMGTPFLLIGDPRLDGGSFYMGSQELEDKLVDAIQNSLDKFGFSKKDLVLSGLSMGTFGALYYGSLIEPGYVILGKPLVNVGSITKRETIERPNGFPTSLDITRFLENDLSEESIERLNQRFWKKFKSANFSETEFIISYMKNDDYDVNAYPELVDYLSNTDSTIIGKGILGRHNDNSSAIIQWFIGQYNRVLHEKFNREDKR